MSPSDTRRPFPSAGQDAAAAAPPAASPQARSPSYRLAYADVAFLQRDELRPVRLQLELLKPEIIMQERGVSSVVVVFGSGRIPAPDAPPDAGATATARRLAAKSRWYEEARAFARLASEHAHPGGERFVIMTGGGGGIMEAANRGAADAGTQSVGLNIVLPAEQTPNRWITPELCFQFHYFAIRKLHFLMRARALVFFPGGFGTLDELFDALTLMQTGKMQRIPIVLFDAAYWKRLVDFQAMVEEGVIDQKDFDLITWAETAAEGWRIIADFHGSAS